MGDNTGKFQFVSVGQGGQPKNANDRKTIRKAAMQAFRRRERLERVKAFAAECAAEAQAKAAAPSPESSVAPSKTGELSLSGPIVLLTKPHLGSGYGIRLEENPTSEGEVQLPSTGHHQYSNTAVIPRIHRDLGYQTDFFCGDSPDIGYLFDYCTYTLLDPFSLQPFKLTTTKFDQSSLKSSQSCCPSRATIRESSEFSGAEA